MLPMAEKGSLIQLPWAFTWKHASFSIVIEGQVHSAVLAIILGQWQDTTCQAGLLENVSLVSLEFCGYIGCQAVSTRVHSSSTAATSDMGINKLDYTAVFLMGSAPAL